MSNNYRVEYKVEEIAQVFGLKKRLIYETLWHTRHYGRKGYGSGYDGMWYIDARAFHRVLGSVTYRKPDLRDLYYTVHMPQVPITLREIQAWATFNMREPDCFKYFQFLYEVGETAIPTLWSILRREGLYQERTDTWLVDPEGIYAYYVLKQLHEKYPQKRLGVGAETWTKILSEKEFLDVLYDSDFRDADWSQETLNEVVRNGEVIRFQYLSR